MVRNNSRIEHQYHLGTVLNLPIIKQTHKFLLRLLFGISPEKGWPHSDHTQPGCGQLDILNYSWKICQEIDGLVIHLHLKSSSVHMHIIYGNATASLELKSTKLNVFVMAL